MPENDRLNSIESRITSLEIAVGRLSSQMTTSPIAVAYPEPVATPLALEKGASLHMGRYFSLIDAGEAFIKYSAAMAISLATAAGHTYDLAAEFTQPPSLGRWGEILREILCSGEFPHSTIANALRYSMIRPNGKMTAAGRLFFQEFINIRNVDRGHTASLPDGAYQARYLRHSDEIHDVLANCQHLQLPLILIESANPATESIEYDIRYLVGPPPFAQVERIHTPSRLRLNGLYVWDRGEEFLDLNGLLIFRTCEECKLNHTFFLEKIKDKIRHYHSYFGNHRYSVAESFGEVK
ncbi:MAG: hypothetical protein ACLFVA_04025 [Dehalococcoidia bacterium]